MKATDSIPRGASFDGHGDFAYGPDRCGLSSRIRPIDSDNVHYWLANLAALLVDLRSVRA
jgi:hypothetical protein